MQRVLVRCFQQGMTVPCDITIALVIGEDEQDIGLGYNCGE